MAAGRLRGGSGRLGILGMCSLALRIVAVGPGMSEPCVAIAGTGLPRAGGPRLGWEFGGCGGHDDGDGNGGGGGYGRRFALFLGAGLRGVVSGTISTNLIIKSLPLRWVVWRPTHH